jgi:dolichol-phosphate mannosyltransferase
MSARELPAYDEHVLASRRSRYALVIPVINEGDRIRQQLRRIAGLGYGLDIVIADGGSTDGSLDLDFLRQVGVRALLVKTGAGRLGAQLRMAYAWALDQGYEGFVTMDGNGKDGVEAIPQFVAALDAGFDYVQGSRYLAGGRGVNTPLDRRLAGRLIHAPVLSLAARRRYTDTTNGFRAYSARYLADPRVDPFRHIFDGYALLFYLTIRASQLGIRTTEIPVERHYPPTGSIPTKITGLGARIGMLKELLAVAFGFFHPRT